ncbi:hypothetical protein MPER_10794 [Moniliophthora perniciosa FA553]|nr:hypothetical protein MPER_10794 [Moniliophthora perniciosa FA553]
MFWFSWTVSASCAGVVRAFSIAPIPQPVTVGIPIYITWFRQSERPDGFVLVQSIVNTGPPSSQAIATNKYVFTFLFENTRSLSTRTYVLQAVQTDAQGNTQAKQLSSPISKQLHQHLQLQAL